MRVNLTKTQIQNATQFGRRTPVGLAYNPINHTIVLAPAERASKSLKGIQGLKSKLKNKK